MKHARAKALALGLAIIAAVGVTAYAAGSRGGQDDPLITKSYLDRVVQPELEAALEAQLDAALSRNRTEDGAFRVLTLAAGQRVTCAVGTELLPRFGAVTAYAYDSADVALVDITDAAAVNSGTALAANHLYMVTIENNGFTAGTDGARVLISGEYRIESR